MSLESKISIELPNTPEMRTYLHKLINTLDPEGAAGIVFMECLMVSIDETRLIKQEPSIQDALENADRRAVAQQNAAMVEINGVPMTQAEFHEKLKQPAGEGWKTCKGSYNCTYQEGLCPNHPIEPELTYPRVVRSWPSSKSGKTYDLLEGVDGNIYCSCPAWKFSKARPKVCKHMEEWAETVARNGAVFDLTRKP